MGSYNLNDSGWKPGQSGNPNGRPAGARNRSSYELRDRLKARGGKDPAEFLSEIVSNEEEPTDLRIAASDKLMPYYYSKLGAVTPPPDPVFMEQAVTLPRPASIRLASENIALLSEMKAQGRIDVATADNLINDNRIILNALIDEQKLLTAQGGSPEQTIRIENSPGKLIGTNVIMPDIPGAWDYPASMNGHDQSEPPTDPQPPEQEP